MLDCGPAKLESFAARFLAAGDGIDDHIDAAYRSLFIKQSCLHSSQLRSIVILYGK